MKFVKYGVIAAAILAVAVLTAPYWGGCKLAYQVCTLGCDLRYLGSSGFKADAGRASCKAGCAADRLQCLAK